ncbi:MAG: hypothetical protein LBB67_08055, partial [Oscillospiraceae bacterium]|nr:hypothetical protein [Oscillospiraceae bacterium]
FGNVPVSDHMAGDAISLDVANELLFNGGIDLSFLQHINKLLETVLGGLKDADGAPLNLKLPTFNPGSLAILGTMRNSEDDALETKRFSSVRRYIEADQADVFLYLLRYLFNTLRDDDFYQKIIGLITDSNALSPIVDEILTNARQNPELAIAALVELFAPAEYDMGDIDWIRCEDTTQYSAFWHKEDAQYLAENLAPFIDGLIKLLGIYDENGKLYSVENLNGLIGALGDSLYAPDLLNSLAAALKDLLANAGLPDEVLDIAAALGVDLRAWDSITEDHFRFANGDRAAFVDGLLELLRPLYPLLRFLLTEDFALSLFDGTLNAHSYAGYAYGIIPILEALGVKNILTPAQYTAAAINPDGTVNDNLVLAFLNPLLNTVDEVLANPLPLLLEKLPNAVYFIKSGGLETSVNNILHAVNVILDTVRPLYSVNLTQMLGIDLGLQGITNLLLDIVNTALGSSFELPNNGMVEALAAGKLTAFTSANGKTSYAIAGDQADTITALLRFAVEFLFHQNNRNEVVGLLADLVGTNVDFLKQIDALFSWMRSLEMRICGADLVMINLLNTMKVTNVFVQGKNNLLDTVNKNWVAILDAMKQSDLAFISDAAKSLEAFLDQNFNGVADGGGVISQGVIPAVNTVMSWFQKLWEILTWPFKMLMSWFA